MAASCAATRAEGWRTERLRLSDMDKPLVFVLVFLAAMAVIGLGISILGLAYHHHHRHHELIRDQLAATSNNPRLTVP